MPDIEQEARAEAVRTGAPEVQLLACAECGVLLWDIDAHYRQAHATGPASATRETVTIPRPVVLHGPAGLTEDRATAQYLRNVVRKIDHGFANVGGSNVTATVRKLLLDVAAALTEKGDDAAEPKRRLRSCVEVWPDAETGAYDPACCRFPKSCSATAYDEGAVADADLEPPLTEKGDD